MNELEQRVTDLLTKLLFVYGQHMPVEQDALIEAHSTMTSTRNLIDALKLRRVRLEKTDLWKD